MPYELIFEVDPLTDTIADTIEDAFDAVVRGHGSQVFVDLIADGPSAVDAAMSAVHGLRSAGVVVRRMVEDLVTRSDIARRAGVTPQAVGAWVRGDRHAGDAFPNPFSWVGGGVWLWGDVDRWLQRVVELGDGDGFPAATDHLAVNVELESNQGRHASVGTMLFADVHMAGSGGLSISSGVEVVPAQLGDGGSRVVRWVPGTFMHVEASYRDFGLAG